MQKNVFKRIYIALGVLYPILVLALSTWGAWVEKRGGGGLMQLGFWGYALFFALILLVCFAAGVFLTVWVQALLAFLAGRMSGRVFLLASLALLLLTAAALGTFLIFFSVLLAPVGIVLGITALLLHRRETKK